MPTLPNLASMPDYGYGFWAWGDGADTEEATVAACFRAWKACSEAVEARGNDPSVWAQSVEVLLHGAILGQPPLP